MGLKDLLCSKRTPFEELWKQVEGIPAGAKKQILADLSYKTKRKMERRTPKEVEKAVVKAFEEINNGSIEPIDLLIRELL
ncbi:MAG: hypothetical protein K6E47_01215 [Lachnospiraceae bacterium]|nr:hypothetical protein [Lachnospiraceae bacterium]